MRMIYAEIGSLNPWIKKDRCQLSEKRLLIIGMGNIGRRVAKKMERFMNIITLNVLTNRMGTLKEIMRVG